MVETVLPNQEREQRQQIVLIEDDLLLRFRAIAETLDIEITGEMEDWLLDKSFQFRQLLAEYTSTPIAITDMEAVRDELQARTDQFCRQTMDEGNIPVVISFDPLLLDSASYIMQENRVSAVPRESQTIDLAANPKGKGNRFPETSPDPRCGAGKTIDQQVAEFCAQLEGLPVDRLRLAIVDGSIITGRTMVNFLTKLPPELQTNGVLAITGSTSRAGEQLMNQNGVAVESMVVLENEPDMTITLADLVPTLGGRMIARQNADATFSPLTIEVADRSLTMAVDSILGGYPSHADLDPFETEQLQAIRQWSLQTGYGLWDALEQQYGSAISWNDLKGLNGKVKIMVPVRQGMTVPQDGSVIPASPKEAILAAARFGY